MAATPRRSPGARAAETALRSHALAKPAATEHFPWGERAIKVNGKVFLFMSAEAPGLSLSVKLPATHGVALMLPFAEPTGYGLGKAGWVSARFEPAEEPPIEMLCAWIDESYQAVAPAKLAAAARGDAATAPARAKPDRAKPARAKPARAKPARVKPDRAKSARAKPARAKPARAKPARAKPARAKPARAKPARAKPARG
jgi:predicted DNA-binding protein (MmcQ/YjbR family)